MTLTYPTMKLAVNSLAVFTLTLTLILTPLQIDIEEFMFM